MKKLSVQEFSRLKKISVQAVYKQIREGKLQSEKIEGKTIIVLDEEQVNEDIADKPKLNETTNEAFLLQKIQFLEEKNANTEKDKEYLQNQLNEANQRAKEANVLHLQAQKQIDKLTDLIGEQDGKIKLIEAKPQGFFAKIKALVSKN